MVFLCFVSYWLMMAALKFSSANQCTHQSILIWHKCIRGLRNALNAVNAFGRNRGRVRVRVLHQRFSGREKCKNRELCCVVSIRKFYKILQNYQQLFSFNNFINIIKTGIFSILVVLSRKTEINFYLQYFYSFGKWVLKYDTRIFAV